MTDEQILVRLAEIEGWEWKADPLTIREDAFALIEKYKVEVSYDDETGYPLCKIGRRYGHYPSRSDVDLKRAICLAVIAAHAQEQKG